MGKTIKYALLTCLIAYLIGAVVLFIVSVKMTGWSGIDDNVGRSVVSSLTLVLSEFQGWGDFWYLAVLVPWLGSSLLLALLVKRNAGGSRLRRLWGGVSVSVYYVIMMLVFATGRLLTSWNELDFNPGDVIYLILLLWPLGGFGLGYLSAVITDKIVKLPAAA
jgi:hypothetical protein